METGRISFVSRYKWLVAALNVLLVIVLAKSVAASEADPLPVETFASLPKVASSRLIQLSPSGEHLAYVLQSEGYSVLAVHNVKTGEQTLITKTDNEKYSFRWLKWISAERFVFSVYFPDRRYGVASGETRLLSAGTKDSELKILLKPRSNGRDGRHYSQFQDRVVSYLPYDPEHILVALDIEAPTFPGVYKVNVNNGKRQRVMRHKKPIRSWVADRQGNIRAGVGFEEDTTNKSLWVRRSGEKEWRKLEEYKTYGRADVTPLGFGSDPDKLYIRDLHEGKYAVFKMDLAAENYERELVASDPTYDVSGGLIWSQKLGDVVGVSHSRAPGSVLYFDQEGEDFQESLARALPDTHNLLVNFTDDETEYLLYTSASNAGGVYYLGNRETGKVTPLIQNYPALQDYALAKSRKIVYEARDGQEIEAYLWLPAGSSAEDLPLIMFPHGGPMSRSRGGFNYWTQFFTHRGYAVLQPNFRGSSGYGHEFSMAALQQWGLAMQDDLEDGVRWLAEEGIVDARRVCIVGKRYGGYAALMGVVKTPDTYRCAISYAGISSLQDLRASARHYLNRKVVNERLGSNKDQLRATSPLYHVDKIKVPILIAHGDRDRTVAVSQSKKMAKALKKARKSHEYLELKNGSHSLSNESNRLAFFRAMDEFLAANLPVESE